MDSIGLFHIKSRLSAALNTLPPRRYSKSDRNDHSLQIARDDPTHGVHEAAEPDDSPSNVSVHLQLAKGVAPQVVWPL